MAWLSNPDDTPAAKALSRTLAWALALTWAPTLAGAPLEVTVSDVNGRPLAGAVVFVESAAARAATKPLSGVDVVQQGKQFVPDVSVVTVGTPVGFPNRDTVRHHVYSFSAVKRFEIKLYVGRPEAPVVFDRAGISVLGCNIHDDMTAWVVVLETPWFARTDAQGRALLPDVPAGRHELRTWHTQFPVSTAALSQALVMGAAPTTAAVRVPALQR